MRSIRSAVIGVVAVAALVVPAFGAQAAFAGVRASKVKVGLAIIGAVNDEGFNALANRGLKMAENQMSTVQGSVVVTPQNGVYQTTLQEFVNNHDSLVVAVGALWGNAVYNVASANKSVHFAIVDGFPLDSKGHMHLLRNVATLQFKSEQSGYIAGIIAGLMEKNHLGAARHNVIAALGAIPLPFINAQMCGFWEGAKSVDKSVTFHDAYSGSFFDTVAAQAIGEKQIQNNHADILFGVADASGLGYYKAAQLAHKYAIGFAADQDNLGNYMLTSAEVGIQVAVFRTIQGEVDGTFTAYRHEFTLKNGGISYAKDMHHVPDYIQAKAATVSSELATGTLVANPNCKLPNS